MAEYQQILASQAAAKLAAAARAARNEKTVAAYKTFAAKKTARVERRLTGEAARTNSLEALRSFGNNCLQQASHLFAKLDPAVQEKVRHFHHKLLMTISRLPKTPQDLEFQSSGVDAFDSFLAAESVNIDEAFASYLGASVSSSQARDAASNGLAATVGPCLQRVVRAFKGFQPPPLEVQVSFSIFLQKHRPAIAAIGFAGLPADKK
jgi:hypothetical protein